MSIKIALVQYLVEIEKDFSYVSRKVERYIKLAKEKECGIICFPEDFWFGPYDYYNAKEIKEKIENETPRILYWIGNIAKKYQINIIAGSFIERIDKYYYNTTSVIDKNGRIIYKYSKQKLVPYGFEKKYLTPGEKEPQVFNLDGIKIGLIICRDLFYPELIKNLRKKEAEIIFVPAFWSKRSNDYLDHHLDYNKYRILSEMKVVDALCQTRSFESEVAICFVNASGKLIKAKTFDVLLGRTQVCLPFLGCVKNLKQNKENIIVFEFDRSIINDARRVYQL